MMIIGRSRSRAIFRISTKGKPITVIFSMLTCPASRPSSIEVTVSNNLFGDILTDLGAAIQGGLGLAASGNIHPGKVSLFEPVHGSAPPLAGKGIANPIGAILTSAMILEYLGFQTLSDEIEEAVRSAVSANETTRDLGGELSTEQAGSAIIARLKQ